MIPRLLCALLLLVLAGCDSKDKSPTSAATPESAAPGEARPAGAKDEAPPDACAVLTEAMLRQHLGIGAEVAIEQRRSANTAHPHCSYSWNTLSEAEKQKRQAELVRVMMERMKGGKVAEGLMDVAMQSGDEEAHLTLLARPAPSPEAAQQNLQTSREMMAKGVKSKVLEQEIEVKVSAETVTGVGDAAYWSPQMNQLSVASGRQLFHVGVKAREDDRNLEQAKALARAIIQKGL
jgi:hypothetical protein